MYFFILILRSQIVEKATGTTLSKSQMWCQNSINDVAYWYKNMTGEKISSHNPLLQ